MEVEKWGTAGEWETVRELENEMEKPRWMVLEEKGGTAIGFVSRLESSKSSLA